MSQASPGYNNTPTILLAGTMIAGGFTLLGAFATHLKRNADIQTPMTSRDIVR